MTDSELIKYKTLRHLYSDNIELTGRPIVEFCIDCGCSFIIMNSDNKHMFCELTYKPYL